MTSIQEIRDIRLNKIKNLENLGLDVYPNFTNHTHTLKQVREDFDKLAKKKTEVTLTGRIMSLRGQGAVIFADLYDGTDKFQALLKEDNQIVYLGQEIENAFKIFKENIDSGDFVELQGTLFTTKTGEPTLEVSGWRVIVKSLRPIPDEFYGIKDEDERYRQRYLDILLNQKTRETVELRSIFWNTIRQFLLRRDFVEVQTPILENTPGGADARPFITHHNALDLDVYLRISVGELWQKKLLVAGLPKVFEIGRVFRNEGMSAEHAQDYTAMEFYQAYSDFNQGMEMIKELYLELAERTFGTTEFEIHGHKINLADKWEIYDYPAIIKEKFDVDVLNDSEDVVIRALDDNKVDYEREGINRERATDLLWKVCRKEITGPGFLINVPLFLEPLAKKSKDNPKVVERFQVILGGSEQGKGFSELNDPVDQSARFDAQEALREGGDDEAQRKDHEYIEAMEYGMPPAFGFGLSERLFATLNGTSVRESQLFPLMRPKSD